MKNRHRKYNSSLPKVNNKIGVLLEAHNKNGFHRINKRRIKNITIYEFSIDLKIP